MTPPRNEIICGDALEVLKTLPSESVDMCVTSPPYWACRFYDAGEKEIGIEKSFEEYLSRLVEIFDEVKRVLKKEGTCFVNLGDTYNGNKEGKTDLKVAQHTGENSKGIHKKQSNSLPEKCICMIPERFAIAMSERGWLVRNKIIWHKKNGMPSSVIDRLGNKYELVYFFTKSPRYFFDLDAIRVPYETYEKRPDGIVRGREYDYHGKFAEHAENYGSPRARQGRKYNTKEGSKNRELEEQSRRFGKRRPPGDSSLYERNPKGKNPGDVWTLTLQPHPDKHVAMFPEKLIEPMVLAGCPDGGLVLDIFMGAGTTAVVSKKLGRHYLGIELNPKYIEIAEKRIRGTTPSLFTPPQS